jgi:hypothetical protein
MEDNDEAGALVPAETPCVPRQFPGPGATPQDWADEDIQLLLPLLWDDEDSGEHTGPTTRGGRPTAEDDRLWKAVCDYLDAGPKSAAANMTPTRMIDFPFSDCCGKFCTSAGCKEGHMNLAKDDCLFERAWVFQVEGCDCETRLILHGHSFLAWSKRIQVGVEKRADDLTSVNWRLARRDASGWKQAGAGYECLPHKKDIPWRRHYLARSQAQVTWKWREWKGDKQGFPPADLPDQGRVDSFLGQKYRRVQTLLKLADEAEAVETLSLQATNKAIRSHGKIEGERDVTCFRKKVFQAAKEYTPANVSTPAAAAGSHPVTVPAAQPMLDSSLLPDPAPMRSPFAVLFAGANMERRVQLKIKEECQIISNQLKLTFGEHAWKDLVTFRADCFADPASFMHDVMEIAPGVLQFSCHGEARGLWFSQGFAEASAIVDALRAHNRHVEARGGQRIQLVVVNACMSGPLAQALCECVDFVIGHGHREVGDEDALAFSKTLYYSLGRGYSLDASFKAAKLASEPFQLHRSCNPEKFFLPGPGQRQSDSDCNELVRFLKGKGLSAIAARFSEVMGMELVEDLERLQAEDLDDPEFSFLRRWHKQKLIELVQGITAGKCEPSRQRPRRQLTFWRRHGKRGRRHDL